MSKRHDEAIFSHFLDLSGSKARGKTLSLLDEKPPCYQSHPEIKFGGGVIVGGSCGSPRKGYDIYVGLDEYMAKASSSFPWELNGPQPIHVHFPIRDRAIPKDVKTFKSMVMWLCTQLQEGKRVHVGCIGGHGRTGLFLSAIKAHMGEKEAIQWVRKNHCNRAVESPEQVAWLVKHFGAAPTVCSDGHHRLPAYSGTSVDSWLSTADKLSVPSPSVPRKNPPTKKAVGSKPDTRGFDPLPSGKSIWK